jgi:hypothetical protein
MLSALPNLANKAFLLGFFLPTFLFVIVLAQLYYYEPWATAWLAAASGKSGTWDSLAYFVVAVWGVSVLLMMINDLQFKMLEGYRFPLSKLPWLWRGERQRFQERNDSFQTLNDQWGAQGDAFPQASRREWERLRRDLVKDFPLAANDHLPTRLGNSIRAFEVYSKEVYGADSIPLWLHLSAVIPADFQSGLDDARAQVNCAVNICFFALVIGIAAAFSLIVGFDPKSLGNRYTTFADMAPILHTSSFRFLYWAVGGVIVSRLAYLFAVELAQNWGDQVKAAFDCYLPDLAKKLGFKLPETGERRVLFWRAVSEQAIYWRPLQPEQWAPPVEDPPVEN